MIKTASICRPRKSARTILKPRRLKRTTPQGRNGTGQRIWHCYQVFPKRRFWRSSGRNHEKTSQSIKSKGWLPNLFRGIVAKAKDFLQNLIREHDMPPKPTPDIDMAEFRHMRNLMIKAQDKAKEIRHLQDRVLLQLKQQFADTKGLFKGKERKALEVKIKETEAEIADRLDKIPNTLKEDGYPNVQVFMRTFREMESVVEQYNRDLAEWERQVRAKQKPAQKEQPKLPERESVLKRLRQLRAEGRSKTSRDKERNPLTRTSDRKQRMPRFVRYSYVEKNRRYGVTHAAVYIYRDYISSICWRCCKF